MKPVSLRITLILGVLFLVQICILCTGFYVSHRVYQQRSEADMRAWAAKLDPLVYEELVLQITEGTLEARDLLLYDTILKNDLTSASVLSESELSHYVTDRDWEGSCNPLHTRSATLCKRKLNGKVVGILPLYFLCRTMP